MHHFAMTATYLRDAATADHQGQRIADHLRQWGYSASADVLGTEILMSVCPDLSDIHRRYLVEQYGVSIVDDR